MSEELTSLTTQIVSAFVSHNNTRPEDVADLLKQVHGRLAEVMNGKPEPVDQAVVPAVPIKKSVTHDAVFCLICGKGHKTLRRHLQTSHDLDPSAYRAMFDLKADYSLTAPGYSEARSGLALQLGLGRKPKNAEPASEPELTKPAKTKMAKADTTKPVRSNSKA